MIIRYLIRVTILMIINFNSLVHGQTVKITESVVSQISPIQVYAFLTEQTNSFGVNNNCQLEILNYHPFHGLSIEVKQDKKMVSTRFFNEGDYIHVLKNGKLKEVKIAIKDDYGHRLEFNVTNFTTKKIGYLKFQDITKEKSPIEIINCQFSKK